MAVFGLSFLALFTALLIAKDRGASFMARLFTSPLTGRRLYPGLSVAAASHRPGAEPALPVGGASLGLAASPRLLLCAAVNLPVGLVHIALGMLCGSLFNEKAVGGVCGALLTNVSAWLSGTWFSLDLVGGAFKTAAYALPFANAVDAGRAALAGDYGRIMPHLWIVLAWALGLLLLAVAVFARKMKAK